MFADNRSVSRGTFLGGRTAREVSTHDGVPKENNYVLRKADLTAVTFYGPAWFNPLQTACVETLRQKKSTSRTQQPKVRLLSP